MKTLVLGPDAVREALNPYLFPRRQVFLVTLDGDILCCDLDEGWMSFKRPRALRHKEWARAVEAAVLALTYQAMAARAIHDDIEDRTEPCISSSPTVIVRLDQ